jgi:hypothetical protein
MSSNHRAQIPLIIYLAVRIPLLLALSFEGLRTYGDLPHFFNLASIPGLPYLDYWIEFPPLFPYLNELVYWLAGGAEHTHNYLLVLVLIGVDLACIALFNRVEMRLYPSSSSPSWRALLFAAILAGLPYAWWYFDNLAVFFLLLALEWGLGGQLLTSWRTSFRLGLAVGLGVLAKIFPVLVLPAFFNRRTARPALIAGVTAGGVVLLPILLLYMLSPNFTSASIAAVSVRRSYETVWALVDGNLLTGGFGPIVERVTPVFVDSTRRNPPVVPPILSLLIFGGTGLYLWLKAELVTARRRVAFVGLTYLIFFLWSSAYSPQWIQHLLPLALLALPFSPGVLLLAVLTLANLLEWPLLLSRGLFNMLPMTILLRLALMLLLAVLFYRQTRSAPEADEVTPIPP